VHCVYKLNLLKGIGESAVSFPIYIRNIRQSGEMELGA
jgi:hypothetical protein